MAAATSASVCWFAAGPICVDPGQQFVAAFEAAAHLFEGEAARKFVFARGARLLLFRGPLARLGGEDGKTSSIAARQPRRNASRSC